MEHLEASEFALRIFLLFLPGLIAVFVLNALTVHQKRTPFDVLATSFVLGVTTYVVYWVFLKWFGHWLSQIGLSTDVVFLHALQDKSTKLSFREIGAVSVTAVVVAVLLSAIANHKLFHWMARLCRITRRSGDLDVWGHVFNSPNVQFATVRDYKHDLVYDGWIGSFSDDAKTSELFLRDVSVYRNSEPGLLYDVGALYLCIDGKDMVVEFRDIAFTDKFLDYRKQRDASRTATTRTATTTPDASTTTSTASETNVQRRGDKGRDQ